MYKSNQSHPLARRLEASGFHEDGEIYLRNGLSASVNRTWCTLTASQQSELHSLGLWKLVRERDRGTQQLEFHIPQEVLRSDAVWDEVSGEEMDPSTAVIDWAEATLRDELPPGWQSPKREEIEDLVPASSLTAQTGPFVQQGTLVCEPNRLAVRFPLVHRVPQELSDSRRAWLRKVVDDVQDRWRMVRVYEKVATEGYTTVGVEVDLTGAPKVLLPELFRVGLDAAHSVVSLSIWSVGVLVDPGVSCRAWEVLPVRI